MRTKVYNNVNRDFYNWANAMNHILGSTSGYDYSNNGGSNGQKSSEERTVRLPMDVWANESGFTLTAYLPGVRPDDVEITMEGEELTIRGQFPTWNEQEGTEYLRRELYHGKFERHIGFNVPINVEEIEATFENGLLSLNVPKAQEILPKQIKIQAK